MNDSWINLGEPVPRAIPENYIPVHWTPGRRQYLPMSTILLNSTVEKVLTRRRSRIPIEQINSLMMATLLRRTNQIQFTQQSNCGNQITQRPAPSAGGVHPIWILINKPGETVWWRYIAEDHVLEEVKCSSLDGLKIREFLAGVVPNPNATLIQFVAEPGKIFARYDEGCSLVWRDAGVLLGYFAIVAEALGLAFLPLGVTGHKWISELTDSQRLVGVGMAAVGAIDSIRTS